jgi:integrase
VASAAGMPTHYALEVSGGDGVRFLGSGIFQVNPKCPVNSYHYTSDLSSKSEDLQAQSSNYLWVVLWDREMREANKLTGMLVARLKKPGRYGDGNGLWLQVSNRGTKAWLFRFMRDGVPRQMGLGALHTVSLREARLRAREARQVLLDGRDPIEARHERHTAQRLVRARAMTFWQCADEFLDAHAGAWKNAKHKGQWRVTLDTYAHPLIGALPVASIDTALILKILRPIWQDKPETASRVRGRIERILDWATVQEFRRGDNPARWRGRLDALLPAKTKVRAVKHHPALSFAELPGFMAELRKRDGVSAAVLEFTILTAARTGEAIGARWDDIDQKAKVWTIPAERMKAGRPHRVPLSNRALAILEALPGDKNGFVFPGTTGGKPISNMAMLKLLRSMNGGGLTVHGFRSTFSDWARERTAYPRDVIEMALAHAIKDKSEAAYRRGDALEKRRRLMAEWARYCEEPVVGDGDAVVALHG